MGKWAELAAKMEGADVADMAISANRVLLPHSPAPNGPNGPIGQDVLPPVLAQGLNDLRTMAVPRISLPAAWPEIVSDAVRLASEGWAAQALRLGWNPLHLWGCAREIGGNEDQLGLAVWMAGRRVLLLDEQSCILGDGPRTYAVCNRRPMPGAVLLWQLGRAGGR